MRNSNELSKKVISAVVKLPYFTVENIRITGVDPQYINLVLSRYAKRGECIRLKRGMYSTKAYGEEQQKAGLYSRFLEYLACELYAPSYLSMEYVLQKHGMLTEAVYGWSLATTKKTATFLNPLGAFRYYSLTEKLFTGFTLRTYSRFRLREATKAKALFDFLYLRKKHLASRNQIEEMRLNVGELTARDFKEFKHYADLEGSSRMKFIHQELCELRESEK